MRRSGGRHGRQVQRWVAIKVTGSNGGIVGGKKAREKMKQRTGGPRRDPDQRQKSSLK
jgi:hypothetical protein